MRRFDVVRGPQHRHFGLAVLAAIGAAAVGASLTPFFGDRNQLIIFYPAIMVSAWCGGFWPGVVATVVSAALDRYLFLEPLFTLRLAHHGDKLALTVFIATGVVISVLNENLHQNAAREHKARADAEQAREEANMANRTKDFFLAAVSHDLRAPMTVALGWADMLSKHMLDEAQCARATEAIRRSLSRQLLLVNDLLDTVAILSGKLRVEQKNVDVEGVVRAALEIAEPLAERKQIRVGMECDAGAGTVVVRDSARLQQVLSNLLTNTIKFTPDGGAVRVRLRRADQSAEIQVIDTGKRIPDSALRFVFDQFWQADGDSSTRPTVASGWACRLRSIW
jgi:K+-sensing histidine kinase KdpD